jgi:glycosyltransferase involved in cell wall biosynthesis
MQLLRHFGPAWVSFRPPYVARQRAGLWRIRLPASEWEKEPLLAHSKDKITFIANGVDPQMFTEPASLGFLREEYGLQDKILAVYTGALGIANDIQTILQAANAGIFVSPGDANALAGAVQSLSDDPALARRCGHSGKAYVTKHFDRNQHAQQLNQLVVGFARKQAA